jgi:hypothetical protein
MSGTISGSTLSCRRIFRPFLGCGLLLAGLPQLASAWIPVVELKFESGTASSPNNTGSAGGAATLSATAPTYSTNLPVNGGAYSLDMGNANGQYYADLTSTAVLNAVKSLKSFTISGWVNCRSSQTDYGGSRIVSWMKGGTGFGGVDLAFRSDGSLGLGVNTWNDQGGVGSNSAKIPVDAGVSYNNWRFFAVSYDGTQTSNNVRFYFGTNNVPATLDKSVTLNQGTVSGSVAASLTVGNVPSNLRAAPFTSVFRGLIDQVRVYGSASNNSGVLTLDQIQSLQQATPLVNVPGVIYDQWNGIAGNTLPALIADSRYPSSPSLTKLQSSFEGFVNTADNFGARLSGWVKAPATGSYTFWIVGDDNGELRLSTDANPDNKRLIASVATYNSTPDSWDQFGSQRSEPVTLQANQYYYLEALVKEGGGNDFIRVGWQLPSGTQERPIPQARMVTTPPDGVPFYPSVYPLYESGTFLKKAAMGWEKAAGNDHFYIKTDETKALIARNGTAIIPERLFFGGNFPADPNQNDLGFRWDRSSQGSIGMLNLETQGGKWAMRVRAPSHETNHEMEPEVEINNRFYLKGDPALERGPNGTFPWVGWSVHNSYHFLHGLETERAFQIGENPYLYKSQNDGINLSMQARNEPFPGMFIAEDSMSLGAGRLTFWGGIVVPANGDNATLDKYGLRVFSNGSETTQVTSYYVKSTDLYAKTITAEDLVITPKWQIPDYVFEEKYRARSLDETEAYVKRHKHLPDIPSAKEIAHRGMSQGEMNVGLLKTVEEMTLHLIELKKELEAQKRETARLRQEVKFGKAGKVGGAK